MEPELFLLFPTPLVKFKLNRHKEHKETYKDKLLKLFNERKGNPSLHFHEHENSYQLFDWKDIEDERIIIHGTKTTSAFRFLPLYPQLKNLLNSIATHRGQIKPNDKVMGRQRIDKALRRACQKVGIQNLRHHDLRHYFATKAVQAGVDMPTIAKWLGHSDGGALAMKVYSNVMDDHVINSAIKLDRSFTL